MPGANLVAYVERIAALAEANSVLSQFYRQRSQDVAAGAKPAVKDSLAAMKL